MPQIKHLVTSLFAFMVCVQPLAAQCPKAGWQANLSTMWRRAAAGSPQGQTPHSREAVAERADALRPEPQPTPNMLPDTRPRENAGFGQRRRVRERSACRG